MSIGFLVWNGFYLALCVLAAYSFKGGWKTKVAVFGGAVVACVIVSLIPYIGFSLTYMHLYPWLMAFIPLALICIGLCKRRGRLRAVGAVVVLLSLMLYGYPMFAWHITHASDPYSAAIHPITYIQAQSTVKEDLNDPDSAEFRGLSVASPNGSTYVCGELNAKNRMGGLVGFKMFFVKMDDILPTAHIVDLADNNNESYNAYSQACYGKSLDKLLNP